MRGLGIVRVHQLQHFALGDHVGRLGHDLHHALRTDGGHHLERARIDEIADQHARLVAVDRVRREPAAAARRAVDDVVVQQRGGVDELDERRRVDVAAAAVAAGTRREQHDQRPQPLATAGDDVFGDLVDQPDRALEADPDHRIDGAEIGTDEVLDVVEWHCAANRNGARVRGEWQVVPEGALPTDGRFRRRAAPSGRPRRPGGIRSFRRPRRRSSSAGPRGRAAPPARPRAAISRPMVWQVDGLASY